MQPFPLGQSRHGAILTNELESRLELLELREEPLLLAEGCGDRQRSILPDRLLLDVPTDPGEFRQAAGRLPSAHPRERGPEAPWASSLTGH